MFTEPAPFGALYARTRPPDALRRRGLPSGQVRAPDGTAGPAAEVPLLPNPDGDVSRTGGITCVFSLGLYLTGLEVLRRLKKKFFFSPKEFVFMLT